MVRGKISYRKKINALCNERSQRTESDGYCCSTEGLEQEKPRTTDMIRNLHKGAGIPAEVLIQPYRSSKRLPNSWKGRPGLFFIFQLYP